MPQPLKDGKQYQIRVDAVQQRTELGIQIATIAALWSSTEVLMGLILTRILGWEPAAGAAIYTDITNTTAQRSLLLAAAASNLAEDRAAGLRTLMEEATRRAGERNKILHALWGLSDDHPDDLIWCSTKAVISAHGWSRQYSIHGAADPEDLFERITIKGLMVYSKRDFSDTISRLSELNSRLGKFIDGFDPNFQNFDRNLGAEMHNGPEKPQEA